MKHAWDIAIIGGGPAGSAAAMTLRVVAPDLRVVLLDAPRREEHRVGETLPAVARGLLEQLGAWPQFLADGHIPASGTLSAWGDATFRSNDFIFSRTGYGWHLRRQQFDETLLKLAKARGTEVMRATRLLGVQRLAEGCQLTVRQQQDLTLTARFVIDATGRNAFAARQLGATVTQLDRLVGIYQLYEGSDFEQTRTVVEACPIGWWYSAGLPGDRHIIALMTDGDIVAERALMRPEVWQVALKQTTHIQEIAARSVPAGTLHAQPAHSGLLDNLASPLHLAVGDAASTFDPLSSLGILKGLRSGIFGAYAAADWLNKQQAESLVRYAAILQTEFGSYRKQHASFYAQERRWPDQLFWQRRQAGQTSPVDATVQ